MKIDQVMFEGGGMLPEIGFFHRSSRAIVFTDLIMDFDPATLSPLTRISTRLNQMYRHTPGGMQLVNYNGQDKLRIALKKVKS